MRSLRLCGEEGLWNCSSRCFKSSRELRLKGGLSFKSRL